MSTTTIKTYTAVYVTPTKTGGVRYHHWSRGRLWPTSAAIAEASFAAGATIYRKEPGACIWATPPTIINEKQ
jgi:hypothetical protein